MGKEEFIASYTGMYNPEDAYNYYLEVQDNESRYSIITHNEHAYRKLLTQANQKAFDKHIRNKLRE